MLADIGSSTQLPTHANNYDRLPEPQVNPFVLIEAGYYYKQLTNPIVASNVPRTGSCTIFANDEGVASGVLATQNINGSNAFISGPAECDNPNPTASIRLRGKPGDCDVAYFSVRSTS